ncbi:nucleotidyltransferase domain protein [mine drainage metagenome]|uniref:Nucleotidyltransferase domain protein n=1 Tax=mine drainage metagenome TaxID=410659 RepID=A0A1J5Q3I4_9ZZZZ
MEQKHPTEYDDLNTLLSELVDQVEAILQGNFCGAYLHGSFALGDADEHSDVDFLIVTHGEVGHEEPQLRFLHAQMPEQNLEWAHHLEGSYVSKAELHELDPKHGPWLYVDNGSREMELSPHDNTAVTRWTLRERGVVLAGPHPKELIAPITAKALRREVLSGVESFPPDPKWWAESLDNAWAQPHVISSFCRRLYSLEFGTVVSKRAAMTWALSSLDPVWSALVQGALDDRPDPWERAKQPARAGTVELTRDFVDYCVSLARKYESMV